MRPPPDYTDALVALRPGEKWILRDNDLSQLEWLDVTPAPTTAEIMAALSALNAATVAEATRVAAFVADPGEADLLARLKTATSAQIDTWLTNNVTNLAQARAVLAAIIKFVVAQKLER